MTIQTTWRHESPAITFAFRYPNDIDKGPVPVVKKRKIGVTIHGQMFDNCFQASKTLGIPYTKVLRQAKRQLDEKAKKAAEQTVEA